MQLNHDNFTRMFSLPWCGDQAIIERCCLSSCLFPVSTAISPLVCLQRYFLGFQELSFLIPILFLFILPWYILFSLLRILCWYFTWPRFLFHVHYLCSCSCSSLRGSLHFYFLTSAHQILRTDCFTVYQKTPPFCSSGISCLFHAFTIFSLCKSKSPLLTTVFNFTYTLKLCSIDHFEPLVKFPN